MIEHDPVVHDPASGGDPVEVPVGFKEPPSLVDEIRRFVRIELSREANERGFESFEEANDLEFSDDDDFSSAHELTEDQEMAMMAVARSSRDNGDSDGSSVESGTSGKGGGKGGVAAGGKVAGAAISSDGEVESESGVQSGSGVSEKSAQ